MKPIPSFISVSGFVLITVFGVPTLSSAQERLPGIPDHVHNQCMEIARQTYVTPNSGIGELARELSYMQCTESYVTNTMIRNGLYDPSRSYQRESFQECGPNQISVPSGGCRDLDIFVPNY